jgi:hypothetical protein
MNTGSVSKTPGRFLFKADIRVKVSKEEARQRSRKRGVGVQEEGESAVELLDRVRGTHFLRGGIHHEESSRPTCRGVCDRTRQNLMGSWRGAISTARYGV